MGAIPVSKAKSVIISGIAATSSVITKTAIELRPLHSRAAEISPPEICPTHTDKIRQRYSLSYGVFLFTFANRSFEHKTKAKHFPISPGSRAGVGLPASIMAITGDITPQKTPYSRGQHIAHTSADKYTAQFIPRSEKPGCMAADVATHTAHITEYSVFLRFAFSM